ncbi:NAD(P)/FAD-dependent oxidoreductase [Marinobacter halotolerans]|uniref:NAD(P)/FAD-dependent oxidoreductase n=1 Tax=Marinobacter halotolerans TaxID=1569211 RepID=UPI001248D4C9|nr:NAD(P)/FAD-dependent oxidoreductase [Marinobacter halotolerans]
MPIVDTPALLAIAFVDVLLEETDANIIMVDKHHKPGGHWNLAYPFVTLHQPSAYYGVSSCELSKGRKDQVGLNKGLNDLATGAEISAYFDDVMRHRFLPTGRVQYFPMCDYLGDGRFQSCLTGETYQVSAGKTVDATYLKTSVPANHTPGFSIAPGVRSMPLNDLPTVSEPPVGFVVIGGGKTGIDACLWLLENGVDPDRIQWIVSRDAWLLDRRNTQPTEEFFEYTIGAMANQFEAIARSESIPDLFDRLEAVGVLLRLDPTVRPSMFHGATVSQDELAQLRRIRQVVRLGRVTALEPDCIHLEQGRLDTSPDHLHIDCSASAISNLETRPIFAGDLITPQTVRSYQPVFSAAFIAHIEAAYGKESDKNRLCGVVPLPNHDTDWIRMMIGMMMNQYQWSQHKEIRQWLVNNRLDGMSRMIRDIDRSDLAKQDILKRVRDSAMPAMAKLQAYAADIRSQNQASQEA